MMFRLIVVSVLLLVVTVHGKTLFFHSNDNIVCPDEQGKCPDSATCCQLPSGKYGCCPFPKAVCCSDHLHCCPNGFVCDVPHQLCNETDSGISVKWSAKTAAIPAEIKPGSIVCPDGQSQCDDDQTCCQLDSEKWGCCPLPKAVCCSDHEHCCPNGYTCNLEQQRCDPANGGDSVFWSIKTKAKSIGLKPEYVVCPDGQSKCGDDQTCCQLESGEWGCCPLPKAVCCSDHEHCCPNGYTCNVAAGRCDHANGDTVALSTKIKAAIIKNKPESVICPDEQSQCDDGQTCCKLESGEWGCCPYPQAVCCSDHEHCCPHGYTCNVAAGSCDHADGSTVAWSTKTKATIIKKKPESVLCPDGQSRCDDGQTCCVLASGVYGCCPLPQAVCCSDNEHCCPNGYTCNVAQGRCDHANGNSVPWLSKTKASFLRSKPESVTCPDGKSECSDGETCCLLASGAYGCCPLPKAVCCSDHEHCCPNGYTCNVAAGSCDHANGGTVAWSTKTKAAIIKNAVCCSDHEHCCPNGYTCNVAQGRCDHATGLSISWSTKVEAKIIPRVNGGKGPNMCPDRSMCGSDQTCCLLVSGRYGCCPLPKATCCDDYEHCCPNGYKCNLEQQTCIRESDGDQVAWSTKTPAIAAPTDRSVCSDQKSRCRDDSTCCTSGSADDAHNGCCPFENAVCCSDGLHCCPAGTACDVEAQMCQSNAIDAAVSWNPLSGKTFGNVYGFVDKQDLVCPDQRSKCPDGSTCCEMQSGLYGCCPYSQAICCADKLHCCPSNSKCDLEHSTCTSENLGVQLPWEMFGRRRAKMIV